MVSLLYQGTEVYLMGGPEGHIIPGTRGEEKGRQATAVCPPEPSGGPVRPHVASTGPAKAFCCLWQSIKP